ncbi:MAG TPA: MBL fold metallo-hydrolase [Dehalococcoidia bacterium]|jgi:glyoxylase-like metal-dependent hydrolase (beta-lactamase superfamily II)
MKTPDIIVKGKDNGEGMVIRHKTSRGTDVFGLAVPNIYAHADWDLGPTWCYLIAGRKTTLVDTGRLGNFGIFSSLLKCIDKKLSDIDRVIITHSHEDHDGNVAEILAAAQAELLAHEVYQPMISYHQYASYGVPHPEFPGSCRLCRMPEQVYKDCLPYHRSRSLLKVDVAVRDNWSLPGDDLSFIFSPGHTADSICIVLEDEVIFTGDTVLPEITAQPSLAFIFKINNQILPEKYRKTNDIYGLMNFIKSLSKIAGLRSQPFAASFPGHRLFYEGRFNLLDAGERARVIIGFHVERCRNILEIIGDSPASIEEIVVKHFPPSRLTGMGKTLAENEVKAHLEVMKDSGDIAWKRGSRDIVEPTGSRNCLDVMGSFL